MSLITKSQGNITLIALGTGTNANNANGTVNLIPDVIITGDLTVQGTLHANVDPLPNFDSPILYINDVASPVDTTGGLRLKGNTDKELFWRTTNNAWSSNVNFDLTTNGSTYQIEGVTVLSATALGQGVAVDGGTY
jgi:hypothetical protein